MSKIHVHINMFLFSFLLSYRICFNSDKRRICLLNLVNGKQLVLQNMRSDDFYFTFKVIVFLTIFVSNQFNTIRQFEMK